MLLTTYIPAPTPAEYQRRVRELVQAKPLPAQPGQHVVSRVLLERFSAPVGVKGEKKVSILSCRYMEAKPTQRGPSGCGKFPDFVRYASGSVERVWKKTEDLLRPAMAAADQGTFFDDPRYARTVRQTVVLHYIRSIPTLILSDQTWHEQRAAHVREWMGRRDMLFWLHRRYFGWASNDEERLRMMAEELIADFTAEVEAGITFRVMVEERFERFSAMLADVPIQLRQVREGELLIGDAPALTLMNGAPGTGPLDGMGLLQCEELILPLGPKLIAVLGAGHGYTGIGREDVDRYNAAQVRAAADHVYLRPGSGLEEAARGVDRADAPNRIPEHLRPWRATRRRGPQCLSGAGREAGLLGERAAQPPAGVSGSSVGWEMSR